MTAQVHRRVFVRNKSMLVTIDIQGSHYVLTGTPGASREQADEEVPSLFGLLKIYEECGIYQPSAIDYVMGPLERIFGGMMMRMSPFEPWRREGELPS